jgi:hypothetical protein
VARRLADLVPERSVHFVESTDTDEAIKATHKAKPGELVLLENTRFLGGEEKNDARLARALAQLGDVFVNDELADMNGKRLGLSRRQFMHTSCGMAAAFLAMNDVYGNVFQVAPAEAREPELMRARSQGLASQFIFDVQTHFVRDDFNHAELLDLAKFAGEHWNPKMKEEGVSSLARYKFQNYVKEIYYDSDTSLALLSGAPFDDPSWWLLSNEQIVKARELINDFAGYEKRST